MIWVSNKNDLSYYDGAPLCHCVTLGHASDMLLQGDWNAANTLGVNYSASVEVWSVDGNNALEVVNSNYYDIYFGKRPDNGRHFFTFRLKSYTSVMCEQKCFLIRIGVQHASLSYLSFAAWTEQYCIKTCCDVPRGITVNGKNVDYITPDPTSQYPSSFCGAPLIRIITTADCYSYHTGKYYGKPSVYQGTYFPYMDINVIEGRVKPRPATITRNISFNCVVQRVESARQYFIEGGEAFPMWRMLDIDNCLHCNNIWVDDYHDYRKLQYAGGVAFERIELSICSEWFRLNPTFEECILRQTYGCITTCEDSATFGTFFVVPDNYQGNYFFDSNGNVIAQNITELLQWFVSNSIAATLVPSITCGATYVIQVSGGIIPPVIYYDSVGLQTQIVPINTELENLCDLIPQAYCDAPVIGTITDDNMPCDAPVIGVITDEDIVPTEFDVIEALPWTLIPDMPPSGGQLSGTTAVLRILDSKTVVASIGSMWAVMDELIAYIDIIGWPNSPQLITAGTDLLGNLQAGWQLTVLPNGEVRFTGTIEVLGTNEVNIKLDNLYYTTA